MFCTKCGTQSPDGARFCRTCGQPLDVDAEVPTEVPAPVTPFELSRPTEAPVAPVPSYSIPAIAPSPVLGAPYAGFWLRVVAYLIDSAVMGLVFGAIVGIMLATVGVRFFRGFAPGVYNQAPNPMLPAAVLGVLLVLLPVTIIFTWIYFAAMESSAHQGTLGKMALGLFVTDLHGQRISFGRATGRFFAKFITGLVPFFIGYIMAGFTEKRQALHDMIAGCLVFKKI